MTVKIEPRYHEHTTFTGLLQARKALRDAQDAYANAQLAVDKARGEAAQYEVEAREWMSRSKKTVATVIVGEHHLGSKVSHVAVFHRDSYGNVTSTITEVTR